MRGREIERERQELEASSFPNFNLCPVRASFDRKNNFGCYVYNSGEGSNQCDQICRNFANFAKFLMKFRNWQNFVPNLDNIFVIGQILNVLDGQMLNK